MADRSEYRLVLILPHSREIAAAQIGIRYELPKMRIPVWTRPVEQLTRLIEERWKIKSLVLDLIVDDRSDSACAIIEIRTTRWNPTTLGLNAVAPEKICDASLMANERGILQSVLSGQDTARGPFSRIGWIDDLRAWVTDITKDSEVTLTDETLHIGAGGGYCLLRLAKSDGSHYWLKATGEPNTREFDIVTFLAGACPQYLPRLVGSRKDWNAWLMEGHGSSLSDLATLEDFRRAAWNMADLQKTLVGKSDALFAVHCGDHRTETLYSCIADLIAYLDEAMALQTSTKAPRLSSSRLKELETALQRACRLQQELQIPDSIMHSDINPGNILRDGNRYVFTDWCEANVGNPFITLEQICAHAARRTTEPELWTTALRQDYESCWTDLLTEHQLRQGLELAPLLSILSALHLVTDGVEPAKRYEPHRLGYVRSLARHMDHQVQTSSLRAALCC
jgi:hypothetical protein